MNLDDETFGELVSRLLDTINPEPTQKTSKLPPGKFVNTWPPSGKNRPTKPAVADPWEDLALRVDEDLAALEVFRSKIKTREWGFAFAPFADEFHSMLSALRDAARSHDPSVQDLIDELYGGDSFGGR